MLSRNKKKGLLAGRRALSSQNKQKVLKPLRARQLIRRFHVLLKNKTQLTKRLEKIWKCKIESDPARYIKEHNPDLFERFEQARIHTLETLLVNKPPPSTVINTNSFQLDRICEELGRIEGEIEKRGGLEVYQAASVQGQSSQRGGDSSKKLVEWLKDLGYNKDNAVALEIGCLNSRNLVSTCGLFSKVVKIDLHSQEPDILEQDFMERPLPKSAAEQFDLISCSLVVNFVPDPHLRGQMMHRITQFLKPHSQKPYLFFVLPLPCIVNSRYFDENRLSELMGALGFKCIRHYQSHKLAYYLYQWERRVSEKLNFPKKELHKGTKRNNFCIVMS
ncbi:hypothetical protein KL918_005311 [Ogataea parapolymorpha]|uniref:25S rRNA adenine-N(1) methyltransferase n=1 Tax=Ogataea parapolymorpha (strain ATCC 26012 / BCRC 20466 / JCM 22074 / NRRL Y-7560 / DL-1) TaxID=871575 RepID=W1QHZ1_OGAPD|nr:putative methyltransferase [Ogataea parapolymorpha DL-1]ESX01919.1 putative methyltransferase [Ogataea parapolymorpha DL-1]KAG7864672.1 hypothetical protein KL918_005311 [Ogataea parapolymorpha]KAG7869711.1 hypothetical protein KL916_005180 [Ogataea parapolymorpha]